MSKRFNKGYVYLLPIVLLIAVLNALVSTTIYTSELTEKKWSVEKHFALLTEGGLLFGDTFVFVIFFSPSMIFTLIYTAMWVVATIIYNE